MVTVVEKDSIMVILIVRYQIPTLGRYQIFVFALWFKLFTMVLFLF